MNHPLSSQLQKKGEMTRLPQRTRQHVLDEEARRYVKSILPSAWITRDDPPDYGVDLSVELVIETEVKGAFFLMQLKGTDNLKVTKDGKYAVHNCGKVSRLLYLLERVEPAIYLVYDALNNQGYWIWAQDYLRQKMAPGWKRRKSATLHLPMSQVFNDQAVRLIEERTLHDHRMGKLQSAVQTARNPYWSYSLQTTEGGFQLTPAPRYPGAEKECPIAISGALAFDQSSEGRATLDGFQRLLKTGESVEISAPFIQGFKLPGVLTDLLPELDDFRIEKMILSTARGNKPITVALSFLDAEYRVIEEIPYVQFEVVQAGTEEMTLSNAAQGIPIQMQLHINIKDKTGGFALRTRLAGASVVHVRKVLRLQQALADCTWLRWTYVETGVWDQAQLSGHDIVPPEPEFVDLLDDLCLIQERTNKPLNWSGECEPRTVGLIKYLASIVRTGESHDRGPTYRFVVDRSGARNILKDYEAQRHLSLGFDYEDSAVVLLGTKLPLGPTRVHLPDTVLTDSTSQTLRALDALPDDAKVVIEVNVGDSGITTRYTKWLPAPAEDAKPLGANADMGNV